MPPDFLETPMMTGEKLHVFSLYADFKASICARWAAGVIVKLAGRHWPASSETWKLDSLTINGSLRKMIAADAANADVLVIALASLARREDELIQWLDSLDALRSNHSFPGLLVGLLGDEENQSQELDWTAKQLIRCAQKTNRDFIWHWMGPDAMTDSGWLTENIEKLLVRKQSAHSMHEQIILPKTPAGSDLPRPIAILAAP